MHPRIVNVSFDSAGNIRRTSESQILTACAQLTILRIDHVIYFANAEYTVLKILDIISSQNEYQKYLVLDFKAVSFIDITGVDELERLYDELKNRGIELKIVSLHRPVQDVFVSSGFMDKIGKESIFLSYADCVGKIFKHSDHCKSKDKCPLRASGFGCN